MQGEFPPFDPNTPNAARMYDYWQGGHSNYKADQRRADEIAELYPAVRRMVLDNRAFTGRAVIYAAIPPPAPALREPVRQFLDLGSGLPAQDCIHATARAVIPDARVAYVDNDPEVCGEADMILDKDGSDGLAAICADLRDPAAVLAIPALREVIDLSQPVCVLLTMVLQFMPAAVAREAVAGYAARLAPGSMVVISTSRNDDPASFSQVRALWPGGELYNHTRAEVESFFGGLEMIPPGLVVARGWRGGMQDAVVSPAGPAYILGGAARKP